jgi:NTE family protein
MTLAATLDRTRHRPRLALALSGGGFRAALFHLGVLKRIAECGWLDRVDAMSGVSGGSILVAFSALRWEALIAAGGGPEAWETLVERPFIEIVTSKSVMHSLTLRLPLAILTGRSRTDVMATVLDDGFFGNRRCFDLPQHPLIVLNATNLISMRAWRFTREGQGDSRFGYSAWTSAATHLGEAVAASAAFPPVFPPAMVNTTSLRFSGPVYGEPPLPIPASIPLTDGGVYENTGTEVLMKETLLPGNIILPQAEFIIVSDGGYPSKRQFGLSSVPGLATYRLLKRCNEVAMEQVSALRRRTLIKEFSEKHNGLLVMLGSSEARLPTESREAFRIRIGEECRLPDELVARIHTIRTHLNRFAEAEATALMYHGYVLTDGILSSLRPTLPVEYQVPAAPPRWRLDLSGEAGRALVAALADSHRVI